MSEDDAQEMPAWIDPESPKGIEFVDCWFYASDTEPLTSESPPRGGE